MAKVHNSNHNLVCVIEDGGVIVIEGKGCRTILTPSKPVKYKI